MYSRIAGTGSYLPEKILTNADLERLVDTSDEWIRSRTGIERRHVVVEGETTSDLRGNDHARSGVPQCRHLAAGAAGYS
jgi:3-oxoacyl-[acyl-carrier-protein] synthase-3